jgi:hypothetical protein
MSFWCHRFDQNSNENIVRISALKFFVASWGLPGSFLGLPGDLEVMSLKATKILRNLHLTFDHSTHSQKLGEDFT